MCSIENQMFIWLPTTSEHPLDLLLGIVNTRVQFKAQDQNQTVEIDPEHNNDECSD